MANLNMKAAFYAAINKGDANEVDRLIDAGADIEGVDCLQDTPLITVVRNRNAAITQLLLEKGANVNKKQTGIYGKTALEVVLESRGDLQIVKLLLQSGGDVNIQTSGMTPLHSAVSSTKDLEKVKVLLNYGCDPNIQTVRGKTAIMIAEAYNFTDILHYLRTAEDALQDESSQTNPNTDSSRRKMVPYVITPVEDGESSKQPSHRSLINNDQSISNQNTLLEENKVEVQRHIIEHLEMSSSRKTHKLTRAEKSIEKKDNELKELESKVSSHQREIQEKEYEIIKLKDNLVTLANSLGEARQSSQNSQVEAFKNLSHITSQICKVTQQINTMSNQHLVLSDQIHHTGQALSKQMQHHHSESTVQQVQLKEELSDKIHLDAGRAAPIEVKCRNPKLRKHQKDIESHMQPDSELLEQLFVEGIIDQDDKRVVESEREILGKRKRILLLLDRDEECTSSDVKYRKVVRSLKECSDTGTYYALGQIMEKDVLI